MNQSEIEIKFESEESFATPFPLHIHFLRQLSQLHSVQRCQTVHSVANGFAEQHRQAPSLS
jgi:hypothetical protein